MNRRLRPIFEFMTVQEKKEFIRLLKIEKEELKQELQQNAHLYTHKLIKQVLTDALDKWELEIRELEYDVKNNIGPISKDY